MIRISASYSNNRVGCNIACVPTRVKGENMPETTDLRATDTRTDGDSSANISGFAVQMLSTPTNAQIIAELNRVKCEFQLRTICAVMGMKP